MSEAKKRRVPLFDTVRGVMIVYVALYHLLYDLVIFRLVPAAWLYHPAVEATHIVAFSSFVAVSGASSRFSRNNLRRGTELVVIAYIITFVTWVLDHEGFVRFGVLHFLGVAALLFGASEKLCSWAKSWAKKKPAWPLWLMRVWNVLFPLSMLAAYVLTYRFIYKRSFPVEGLAWLGFPSPAYFSTDYFPLVPFLFLYFFGLWVGRIAKENKLPARLSDATLPGFSVIGRYTLWIYLAHQPIFYGLAWIIAAIKQG